MAITICDRHTQLCNNSQYIWGNIQLFSHRKYYYPCKYLFNGQASIKCGNKTDKAKIALLMKYTVYCYNLFPCLTWFQNYFFIYLRIICSIRKIRDGNVLCAQDKRSYLLNVALPLADYSLELFVPIIHYTCLTSTNRLCALF